MVGRREDPPYKSGRLVGVLVTTEDLKAAKYCAGGTRRWFAAHDLDWSNFVFHGLDEDVFLATGDALVTPLLNAAHKRIDGS